MPTTTTTTREYDVAGQLVREVTVTDDGSSPKATRLRGCIVCGAVITDDSIPLHAKWHVESRTSSEQIAMRIAAETRTR